MPSLIKNSLINFVLGSVVACATTQGKKRDDATEANLASQAFLDWLPLEARLADRSSPVDDETRDRVVATKIAVQERAHELEEWIVPLLSSYLPRGDKLAGRVVLDIGRPIPVEVTANGIAYIDVTAPHWKNDPERLWVEIVGALYRCALTQALPVRQNEPTDADSFASQVLEQLMLDGLSTYVTAQGAAVAHASTPDAALELRDEKSDRFQKLEGYMASARTASPTGIQELWRKIRENEPRDRLLGIAGAAMAEAIEARESRIVLMDKVSLGHRSFYNAYMEGRPGALASFRLPPEAAASRDDLPPPPAGEGDSTH